MSNDPMWPFSFPDKWASEWGEDECGLWMAFHYEKIRYVMRWIEPPANDPEINKGFWLGAEAVPEDLWKAVLGNSPNNTQDLISRLNQAIPKLELDVPTEIQWMFACDTVIRPFFVEKNSKGEIIENLHYSYSNNSDSTKIRLFRAR